MKENDFEKNEIATPEILDDEQEEMEVVEEATYKEMSPTRLIFRRFFRSKLSIVGLVMMRYQRNLYIIWRHGKKNCLIINLFYGISNVLIGINQFGCRKHLTVKNMLLQRTTFGYMPYIRMEGYILIWTLKF